MKKRMTIKERATDIWSKTGPGALTNLGSDGVIAMIESILQEVVEEERAAMTVKEWADILHKRLEYKVHQTDWIQWHEVVEEFIEELLDHERNKGMIQRSTEAQP